MFSNVRSSSSQGNIVEFKAGRCKLEPGNGATKRNVVAEKEKGLVFIRQSNDQLMHFCWKNRETGALVDDLIIFPGDTEFKEVKGCPNGEVFILKFKSSDERRLFWIQEGSLEGDIVKKVNDALNKPPPPRPSGRERNTTGGGLSSISASDTGFQELGGALGGLDQNQLMQLLQFMSPAGSSEAAAANVDDDERELPGGESTEEQNGKGESGNREQPASEKEEQAIKGPDDGKSKNNEEMDRGPDDEMELD